MSGPRDQCKPGIS